MPDLSSLDLNALVLFDAVARQGGFTAAAEHLGVTKTKVSLQIGRLEAALGTALFARTTRQVRLTDAGQALHAQCGPLLQRLHDALEQGRTRSHAELSGTLRVSTTVDQAVQSLAPALARFAALHPRLAIELRTSDKVTNLVGEGIDVAIRVGWLRDSAMHAATLGQFRQCVVAAPQLVRRLGRPVQPGDLAAFEWITLTLLPAPLTWTFTAPGARTQTVRLKSRIRVDSPAALRAMLCEGTGISVLDEPGAADDLRSGRLVRLLDDWSLPAGGIHAVYPPGRQVSGKVRAFIDFYRAHLNRAAQPAPVLADP